MLERNVIKMISPHQVAELSLSLYVATEDVKGLRLKKLKIHFLWPPVYIIERLGPYHLLTPPTPL